MEHNEKLFTTAIHAGNIRNDRFGALATPIYATSTFAFDSAAQGGARFAGQEEGYIYTRLGNPTTAALEQKVAALEGAESALALSSGMGAVSAALWTVLKAGDHVLADRMLYGCTFALLSHGLTRFGVEVDFVDTADLAQVGRALRPNTRVVYLETPANPTLKVVDLAAVAELAHRNNPDTVVICDNTFASPVLQRPLALGCDLSLHSATKYLNGHGDVIAGILAGSKALIDQCRMVGLKDMTGAVPGPFESYLVLRGLKTLPLRMARHCANAQKVAEALERHPVVERVFYPGLPSHPGHALAARQMDGFGAIIAFEVRGGRAAGVRLCDAVRLCILAVSLGDCETLIEHPASMTHSTYSPADLRAAELSEGMLRLSVGLEDPQDIIDDLYAAIDASQS